MPHRSRLWESSVACLMFALALDAQSPSPAAAPQPIAPRAQCMPLAAVRLLPGELKTEQDAMLAYLRTEDLDRLLHAFRQNAGLPSTAAPLGGWESPDCELRGHYTGHFLSALALMYESTGDEALRERGALLVRELGKCQEALGGGYLSAFPKAFLDRLVRGERVWAPWYTLHKIAAGLLDQHLRCGNADALAMARRFADFVDEFTRPLDDAAMQRMLGTEFGGMPAFFADLYAVTRDERHLALARRFAHRAVLDPLADGRDALKGLHANTQIPKIIAQARLFELTGDPRSESIARFFWTTVTQHRCYATGGTSSFEYWRDEPDRLAWQRSAQDAENCCTHNLLKLTRLLWQQRPSAQLADYYERALWNGILGTRSPDDAAAIMYYVPMQSGLYRYYCERDNAYVCCSGTGIESFSRLGEFVYGTSDDTLWVNLFTPSEVEWKERGLRLRQETKFPDEGKTTLVVASKSPVRFTLAVRRPFWCKDTMAVTVGGEAVPGTVGDDGYVAIAREWRDGDRIEVTLPMALRTEPLGDEPSLVAVCCGPIVLAADFGRADMSEGMRKGLGEEAYRRCIEGAARDTPVIDLDAAKPRLANIRPLTFQAVTETTSRSEVLVLRPFYRLREVRYSVYVHPVIPEPGIVDDFADVEAGTDWVFAADTHHDFQAWRSERGLSHGLQWVRSPLWFRYDLDVDPKGPNTLHLVFARDEDATTFELCIDGVLVATPTLAPPPGERALLRQDFELPRSATDGRTRVAVMLRVPPEPKAVARGATTVPAVATPRRTPRVFLLSTNGIHDALDLVDPPVGR